MLTVSLHKIQVHALLGLYQQEQILHNHFEADLDVQVPAGPEDTWPMIDYSRLNTLVREAFLPGDELLETLVRRIYTAIRRDFPEAGNIKVTLRKMNPPMPGNIAYAQVMFEA